MVDNNRPELARQSVQNALRAIERLEPLPQRHPFHDFLIFRQQMQQRERLSGDFAELGTVAEWLEGIFADKLGADDLSTCDIMGLLAESFREANSYRQGLIYLYARYMRSDLDMRVEELAKNMNTDRQTLLRREKDALSTLAFILVNQETAARRQQYETLLKSRIPLGPRDLLGRDDLVASALATLRSRQAPVMLVGIPGLGKTTLAAQIALTYLPEVKDLYWVTVSPEMDCIAQIAELVSPAAGRESRADVLSYLIDNTVLLVLDGIESQHLPALRAPALNHAALLCTSRKLLPDWHGVSLNIKPLERDQALRFYEIIHGDSPDVAFDTVFRLSDGVPGAMWDHLRLSKFLPQGRMSPERYFASTWQSVSAIQRQIWQIARLAEQRGTNLQLAESLLNIRADDLTDLVSNHVLEVDSARYQITAGASAHIDRQLMEPGPLDGFAQAVIAQDAITLPVMQFVLDLIRAGLLDMLSDPHRLLNALAVRVAKLGLWENWAAICEKLNIAPDYYGRLWLQLEDARQQRWRGDLAESLRMLHGVVQDARDNDFPDLFARGLLEMSIIASLREDWPMAAEAAEDAETTFADLRWDAEAAQAVLVQARALMPSDPAAALTRIKPLTIHYDNAASLACEICLQIGELDTAANYANQAVTLTEPETPNYGRALSLLALCLHGNQRAEPALDCQIQAINILQDVKDVIGMARGFNNLGVIYNTLDERDQAEAAFTQAREILLAVQDSAGLNVVLDNLQHLDEDDESHLLK